MGGDIGIIVPEVWLAMSKKKATINNNTVRLTDTEYGVLRKYFVKKYTGRRQENNEPNTSLLL